MRIFVRFLLVVVFTTAVALAVFLLVGPKSKETWATLTAVLALIAAVVAAWPSLRVLEIQENATRPYPAPYFDVDSRYELLQLRVKNIGAGVAFDVRLSWDRHPKNAEGEEVTELDNISVLMPQDSVSIPLGTNHEMVKKYSLLRFEGTTTFKDAAGKERTQRFRCSADEHRNRLTFDRELPKTLHELQKLPDELAAIRTAVEQIKNQTMR